MSDPNAPRTPEENEEAPEVEADQANDERVQVTPGLVIMGVVAVALGIFSALVMSARSLAP